jgi:hypothetical protein
LKTLLFLHSHSDPNNGNSPHPNKSFEPTIHPIEPVAKNICNAPWWVQGKSIWITDHIDLVNWHWKKMVVDSLIVMTKKTPFTILPITLYKIVLS